MNQSSIVYVDQYGSYIKKTGNRFLISSNKSKKEYSADKIVQLIFAAPSSISSEAIRLAVEKNIDLVYLDYTGKPFARTYRTTLGGTTLTRKKQLEATLLPISSKIVLCIVEAKIRSQINFIKSLAKDRKTNKTLQAIAKNKTAKIDKSLSKKSLTEIRPTLLGIEGSVAAFYFKALGFVTGYKTRDPKASDEFNVCLNYAYGILYNEVERACILAGLDPYLGFYHTDRYGKPCLVLDMIELFRVAVADRAVVTLFTRKELKPQDFDKRGSLTLSDKGRRKVLEAVIKRLNTKINYKGKKFTLKDIILIQSRELAAYLLGNKKKFDPFVYR